MDKEGNAAAPFMQGVRITPPEQSIYQAVKKRWDRLAKPLDGLGRFEEYHARIGAIQGTVHPNVEHNALLIFCADNGIVAEGVSQSDMSVTRACAVNLGKKETAACALARKACTVVIPVDVGIARPGGNTADKDMQPEEDKIPHVENRKIRFGTGDFLQEPAMSEEEAQRAITVGMDLVWEMKELDFPILAIGELGIGNTTTSACVAAALLGCSPEEVVGRGAGLTDEGLARKKEVVAEGLAKWQLTSSSDPLRVLSLVGGLDIAAMAGACIGGARYHVPIVLDGMISMTAALVAERLMPGVREYLIPSHMSREPAAKRIADILGLSPVIDADMALGEGSGAVMMLSLLTLADSVYTNCIRFKDSGVQQYERYGHQ